MSQHSPINVGDLIRFRHPLSNGGEVRFSAPVVKVDEDYCWVRFSKRVRNIPFPPAGGARYGKCRISAVASSKVQS